jgi:hypothetical protein
MRSCRPFTLRYVFSVALCERERYLKRRHPHLIPLPSKGEEENCETAEVQTAGFILLVHRRLVA